MGLFFSIPGVRSPKWPVPLRVSAGTWVWNSALNQVHNHYIIIVWGLLNTAIHLFATSGVAEALQNKLFSFSLWEHESQVQMLTSSANWMWWFGRVWVLCSAEAQQRFNKERSIWFGEPSGTKSQSRCTSQPGTMQEPRKCKQLSLAVYCKRLYFRATTLVLGGNKCRNRHLGQKSSRQS